MLSLKKKYENVIIIRATLSEEDIKAVVKKFKDYISENAKLIDFQEWGKRKLAYPINYEHEGYYVLFEFESGHDFPAELTRQYKIYDKVVRFIVVSKEDEKREKKVKKDQVVSK